MRQWFAWPLIQVSLVRGALGASPCVLNSKTQNIDTMNQTGGRANAARLEDEIFTAGLQSLQFLASATSATSATNTTEASAKVLSVASALLSFGRSLSVPRH